MKISSQEVFNSRKIVRILDFLISSKLFHMMIFKSGNTSFTADETNEQLREVALSTNKKSETEGPPTNDWPMIKQRSR